MIKHIGKIENFGIYKKYSRPVETNDFGIKNLFYGWNYSGKTTLSRLFHQLERKSISPDFSGCKFVIETDSVTITENNISECQNIVRVFNSDFISENLNFTGERFNPILLLGSESEVAQKNIDRYEEINKKIRERISILKAKRSSLESDYSMAKRNTAAQIKTTLGIVQSYNATHLSQDIARVLLLEKSNLLNDEEYTKNLKLALTQEGEKPKKIDQIKGPPSIVDIYDEALSLLPSIPSFSNTIEHLKKNPEIERWVDEGRKIHKTKESCEFCGNSLDPKRLDELKEHFSKDLLDHKSRIEALKEKAIKSKAELALPTEDRLFPQLKSQFISGKDELEKSIKAFNAYLEKLVDDIAEKIESVFTSITPSPIPDGAESNLSNAIEKVNVVINLHNETEEHFTKEKSNAFSRVKFHLVEKFIEEQKELKTEKKIKTTKNNIEKYSAISLKIYSKEEEQRAIISKAQIGREEINKKLSAMLGSETIQIKVTQQGSEERFQLIRKSGRPAKNLSDGERTAIAFSYFLTKLKELEPEDFSQSIIYIDDPISSLDANHIFQVTAAIKELFFKKDDSSAWTTTCQQIFISTHNFDFFSLIRELNPKKKTTSPLYLIKRINDGESTLTNMPDSLSKYSSEYHFLFETIYNFHISENKTDHEILMLLPNAVRRFIELYTYSRVPSDQGVTVDTRAEKLFGAVTAKRILKVLHFFSHGNSVERLAGNSELIFDTEYVIKELFDFIRDNDSLHWESLLEART